MVELEDVNDSDNRAYSVVVALMITNDKIKLIKIIIIQISKALKKEEKEEMARQALAL